MWLLVVILGLIPVQPFVVISSKRLAPIVTPTGVPAASSASPSMPSLPPLTLPSIPVTMPTLPSIRPNVTLPSLPSLPSLPPGITLPSLPLIDPRLGTAMTLKIRDAETFAQAEVSTATSSKELNSVDGAINFPKSKRSITYSNRQKRQANCGCFITSQCPVNVTTTTATTTTTPPPNTNGAGLIDFRIVGGGSTDACMTGFTFCCVKPTPQVSCGSRMTTNTVYPTVSGQAKYGDYPWMVVILGPDNAYVGGGTLIDTQHVITTAHRISNFPNGAGLKIRLGEWDASGNYEQYPYKDFTVTRVWTHESFNPNTLQNDISLIRISGGITGVPSVVPVCMPPATQVFDGQRCWVSGWGKDAFGVVGTYQTVLKAIDVPILPSASCETSLRATRLGTAFILDKTSFLCAGGEANKDACTGDGGSGLVCETTPGRWVLAGMVAWGIGCASQGVPAAYVNVINYLPWLTSKQSTP